jgi:hypothetical protein
MKTGPRRKPTVRAKGRRPWLVKWLTGGAFLLALQTFGLDMHVSYEAQPTGGWEVHFRLGWHFGKDRERGRTKQGASPFKVR